jgi:hypothetical protein
MANDTPARTLAVAAHSAYRQRLAAARDGRLSEAHRLRKLAYAWVTTRDRLKALAIEHSAQVDAERLRLQQAVYGYPADPERLRVAIDSAAASCQTREAAARALRRAERTSDPVGALAVFNIAAEKGWPDVTHSYLASRPDAAEAYRALLEHQQAGADVHERLFGPLKFPPLPVELAKHGTHLEQLASEAVEPPPGSPFLPTASR